LSSNIRCPDRSRVIPHELTRYLQPAVKIKRANDRFECIGQNGFRTRCRSIEQRCGSTEDNRQAEDRCMQCKYFSVDQPGSTFVRYPSSLWIEEIQFFGDHKFRIESPQKNPGARWIPIEKKEIEVGGMDEG